MVLLHPVSARVRAAAVGLTLLVAPAVVHSGEGLLIRLDARKQIVVEDVAEFPGARAPRGLLLWAEDGRERFLPLTDGWEKRYPAPGAVAAEPVGGVAHSRGRGSEGGASAGSELASTLQLPPGDLAGRLRAVPGITPVADGRYLNGSVVVRRFPTEAGKFPAVTATLRHDRSKEDRKIEFAAGEGRKILAGLSPGRYTLIVAGSDPVQFDVADAEERSSVSRRAAELTPVLGKDDPLITLVEVEELLTERTKNGVPVYLGDALDRLEALPPDRLTLHLKHQRDRLLKWADALTRDSGAAAPAATVESPTGVREVDEARAAMTAGRLSEAEALLVKAAASSQPRTKALAALYRAMIIGEAGAARAEDADVLFTQAINELPPADQERAHNNYAVFLHQLAQDRLNNHAMQMAAGVDQPVLTAVRAWNGARREYAQAAEQAPPAGRAAIRVNQARLMTLLADLIRTVDPKNELPELVTAATAEADRLAGEAATTAGDDALTRGIALAVRAQLAFRAGDARTCAVRGQEALTAYVQAGFIAGAEQVHRLLAQSARRDGNADAALRHFEASHVLAELLRDQLPPDEAGRGRAGFFARRAFVLDEIVELLLEKRRDADALAYAELAKARALQDVLAGRAGGTPRARPVAEVLKAWPAKTGALEYFLGRDRAWVFVVRPDGGVRAFPLLKDGKPAEPRAFLAEMRAFLRDVEGYARRLLMRLNNSQGYDNSWEAKLHGFARLLLPDGALAELKGAETVVLVPQHVLHYFPFAALVTSPDPGKPGKERMATPKFLIEEFALVNAPSLTTWDAVRRQSPDGPVITEVNAVGLVEAPGEPPLPGVETDLNNLRTTFGRRVKTVLTAADATTKKARGPLGRPGLLLLATHGFNEADRPLDSYLLLLPDPDGAGPDNDGRLRARDIFSQDVRAGLVIMSACYTGLGDRSPMPGDDLFGLQRAFLHAGARAVLAGLWDVFDGTAPELMGACMANLAAGQPIDQALRNAQLAFLKKYRGTGRAEPFLHPYFWAVYSLLGDGRVRIAAAR